MRRLPSSQRISAAAATFQLVLLQNLSVSLSSECFLETHVVSSPLKMYFHSSPRARLHAGSPELTLILGEKNISALRWA